MSPLFLAAGLLVLAQLVGLYGLWTRQADLVFSILMLALLVAALFFGAAEVSHLRAS